MEEQTRKRLIALAVVLIVAIIIGVVYYVVPKKGIQLTPRERSQQTQEALDTLSNPANSTKPVLTPAQKESLKTLGQASTSTAPKQSTNTATQEDAILKSLQSK